MTWQPLSLHFKQTYDGAYRYLDRCGEFILAAVEKMNFMPGDPKPTGAKLDIPEHGLTATIDCLELAVVQELPDDKGEFFFKNIFGTGRACRRALYAEASRQEPILLKIILADAECRMAARGEPDLR